MPFCGSFQQQECHSPTVIHPLTETLPQPMGIYQPINRRTRMRVGYHHKSRSTMADPALASDPELHGLSYIYERNGRHYCLTMATPTVVPNPPAKFSESA
jgi:hypothetical protein